MKNFSQNNDKKVLWLSIIRKSGIGPKTFWQRYANDPLFSDSETVDVHDELQRHQVLNVNLCAGFDDAYPLTLRDLVDAPPIFSYAGKIELLKRPCMAIVGARNASPGGRKIAFELAEKLGKAGFVIVSGMARGIDGAAHEGAIETGTIAVLAGGIDQVYPPEHQKLYDRLTKEGCIISEMPLGTAPAAPLFPRRNRIIAALCQGIVVIEAAQKSGTLITVQQAVDLGRDVFVVPGSPLDPRSRGGNNLIKQGAILVETVDDILAHYENGQPVLRTLSCAPDRSPPKEAGLRSNRVAVDDHTSVPQLTDGPSNGSTNDLVNGPTNNPADDSVSSNDMPAWLVTLGLDPISVEDILMQHPKLTTKHVFSTLAILEMDGLITRFPDGRIARRF